MRKRMAVEWHEVCPFYYEPLGDGATNEPVTRQMIINN